MFVKPAERLTFTGRGATRAAPGPAAGDAPVGRDGGPADTLVLENEYVSPDIAGEAERASVPEKPFAPVVTRSNEADSPARAAAYTWTADTLKSGPAVTFVGN